MVSMNANNRSLKPEELLNRFKAKSE